MELLDYFRNVRPAASSNFDDYTLAITGNGPVYKIAGQYWIVCRS